VCHPRLFILTDIETDDSWGYEDETTGKIIKPFACDLSIKNMTSEDVCLIDNGEYLYLYIGQSVPDHLILKLFGFESFAQMKHYGLESLDAGQECPETTKLWGLIEQIRSEKGGAY
jgi:hypothetical protein